MIPSRPADPSALALRVADWYHAGSALTAHSARNPGRTIPCRQRPIYWRGTSLLAGLPPGTSSRDTIPRGIPGLDERIAATRGCCTQTLRGNLQGGPQHLRQCPDGLTLQEVQQEKHVSRVIVRVVP